MNEWMNDRTFYGASLNFYPVDIPLVSSVDLSSKPYFSFFRCNWNCCQFCCPFLFHFYQFYPDYFSRVPCLLTLQIVKRIWDTGTRIKWKVTGCTSPWFCLENLYLSNSSAWTASKQCSQPHYNHTGTICEAKHFLLAEVWMPVCLLYWFLGSDTWLVDEVDVSRTVVCLCWHRMAP